MHSKKLTLSIGYSIYVIVNRQHIVDANREENVKTLKAEYFKILPLIWAYWLATESSGWMFFTINTKQKLQFL